jgi:hypothetical protein
MVPGAKEPNQCQTENLCGKLIVCGIGRDIVFSFGH